jgi:hypothetical protein
VSSVSSISHPSWSKCRDGLGLAPWSGAPNQYMVGGPPSHSAIKREVGPWRAVRDSPVPPHSPPTDPNRPEGALERREAPPPPPPSTIIARHRYHRPEIYRRVRTDNVTEQESPLPPCVKLRPPLRPRPMTWLPTSFPLSTSMVCTLLTLPVLSSVVLVIVDIDPKFF